MTKIAKVVHVSVDAPIAFFSLLLLSLCGNLLEISMCINLTIVILMCLYYWAFGNDETCGEKT
jgi:hypothetical protein